MNKKLYSIIGGVVLYLISTGITFTGYKLLSKPTRGVLITPIQTGQKSQKSKIVINAPKTEVCPINGAKFSKEEKNTWEARRPLAIMVENHADSRPQSGLSNADVVYEAIAEGGITRFMGVFYCGASAEDVKVAPVRSARVYYINWASEYGQNPIYVHVGGANNFSGSGDTVREARALEMLADIKWRYKGGNDFDASFDLGFPVFWRDYERLDHEVATEHTMVSTTGKIWAEALKRGLTLTDKKGVAWNKGYVAWKFKDDAAIDKRGDKGNIRIEFSGGYTDYIVEWQYNEQDNIYNRLNGGKPHMDLNFDEQLKAKTIIVQFTKELASVDRNKHTLYGVTGSGKAVVFQDGQAIQAIWSKKNMTARTIYLDSQGKEIAFTRGQIWIEIIPLPTQLAY